MFLQGDLQSLFDALYHIGAIDPVLKLDWEIITADMSKNPFVCEQIFSEINNCVGNKDLLMQKLSRLDEKYLHFVAIEVAREYCEFQERKVLH